MYSELVDKEEKPKGWVTTIWKCLSGVVETVLTPPEPSAVLRDGKWVSPPPAKIKVDNASASESLLGKHD